MQIYLTKLRAQGAALELTPGHYKGEWNAHRCVILGVHYQTNEELKTKHPQKCLVRVMGDAHNKFGMIVKMIA